MKNTEEVKFPSFVVWHYYDDIIVDEMKFHEKKEEKKINVYEQANEPYPVYKAQDYYLPFCFVYSSARLCNWCTVKKIFLKLCFIKTNIM